MQTYHDEQLTNQMVCGNSVHLTIGQAIGIQVLYIKTPIVCIYSNYNHNYTLGRNLMLISRHGKICLAQKHLYSS